MRAETVLLTVFLVFIVFISCSCTPQEIAEIDEHTKDMLITYTTPQAEPPKMIETFTRAEKTEIINPYFSLQNSTGEIFRVDHAGNFYLYPLINCDTLDTDGSGLLSCGTDDAGVESLSSADDYISVDTPTGAVEIDFNESKLSTTYYNVTQSAVIAGTIDGTIDLTQHPDGNYDGITLNITEASGSPGLDVRLNFTGIDDFNRGVMRYYTSGLSGDYPIVQMWNYDDSIWEDYPPVADSESFATMTQPVFDSTDHIQDGVAQMRIYKSSNGNTNNHYYVDWIAISKGYGTPSGVEVDPYSIHRDGNTPLTGNWDAGNYNLTVNGLHLDKINSSHHRIWS